jgi:hypothetical protein
LVAYEYLSVSALNPATSTTSTSSIADSRSLSHPRKVDQRAISCPHVNLVKNGRSSPRTRAPDGDGWSFGKAEVFLPRKRVTADRSIVQSELNTNGFVVLNPALDYRLRHEVVPNNVVQLTTHLQNAVDELWPNRFGSRYKRVKVLLASWDADDLGVIKEVRALEHVFIDFYRFDVSTYIIPSHHPDRALTRQAIEFVDSALKDTLLIFYYAGHASMNPYRYESVIWSA